MQPKDQVPWAYFRVRFLTRHSSPNIV